MLLPRGLKGALWNWTEEDIFTLNRAFSQSWCDRGLVKTNDSRPSMPKAEENVVSSQDVGVAQLEEQK
jgi:hypothetical protein